MLPARPSEPLRRGYDHGEQKNCGHSRGQRAGTVQYSLSVQYYLSKVFAKLDISPRTGFRCALPGSRGSA